MSTERVYLDVEGGCGWLTLNRPDKHNALSSPDWSRLSELLAQAGADPGIRVLVLRGAGERAFSTGADLAELAQRDPYNAYENALRLQRICGQAAALRKPTVAMLRGYAVGGGLELALACSLRIAGRSAQLGLPEVSMGTLAGAGGTQRVSRMAPSGVALRMLLLGEMLDADRALAAGLVDDVVDDGDLEATVTDLAGRLAAVDSRTAALILDAVRQVNETPLAPGLAGEAALFGLTLSYDTYQQRITKFLAEREQR